MLKFTEPPPRPKSLNINLVLLSYDFGNIYGG